MNNQYKYDYDGFTFTLVAPDYWHQVYRGKPHEKLYHDYAVLLNKLKTLSKDRWVLDVGVNHGIFSIPACMLGYKVFGFEPVVENYNDTQEAMRINKLDPNRFIITPNALWSENTILDIYIPECTDNSSASKEAAVANMKNKNYRMQFVAALRFDTWVEYKPEYSDVGFIKIDTQGAEYNIIEGMEKFLTNAHDVYMVVEYEDHLIKMGHSFEQLDDLILSYGFEKQGKITGNDFIFYKQ